MANIDFIILFFVLGALASWMKSDLEIPPEIARFLSIFLLLSLGLKGGHEVRQAEDLGGFLTASAIGLASCVAIPAYLFLWLREKFGKADAAALAACYGSVSAVTLVVAQGMLERKGVGFSGYMVAVMALMEVPAIVMALFFIRRSMERPASGESEGLLSLFSAKSVVLLIGGFVIGCFLNEPAWASLKPVFQDAFKGVLAFFFLGLGIVAQRQFREAWRFRLWALVIACVLPLVHGTSLLYVGHFFGLSTGDAILLAVLGGSASYIAAPAAISSNLPQANPSLYVALPLAITFPMNVLFGVPFYIELAGRSFGS